MACIVCNDQFLEGENIQNVGSRGRLTLIQSSKDRSDSKWVEWENMEILPIHEHCRKSYTNKNNVSAAQKRKKLFPEYDFDFHSLCIICGKNCNEAAEKRQSVIKRRRISYVSPESNLKQTLMDIYNHSPDDEECMMVYDRIKDVPDLSTVNAKYHYPCFLKFRNKSYEKKGTKFSLQFQKLFKFFEKTQDCQWEVEEIFNEVGEPRPSLEYMKRVLHQKYGKNIRFKSVKDKTIVTLSGENDPNLELFFEEITGNEDQATVNSANDNILKKAAEIIRNDICLQTFDTSSYPPSKDFFHRKHIDQVIPRSLNILLNEIITKRKKDVKNCSRKINSIAHSIISATRPNSFTSTLHLSLSLYALTKFRSKQLVDILHHLGYASSFTETKTFEDLAVMSSTLQMGNFERRFVKYALDNADHDIMTLDDTNTFHNTGGIECSTPGSAYIDESSANHPIV